MPQMRTAAAGVRDDGVEPFRGELIDLPSREVFRRGQKRVQVFGPLPEVEEEITALHRWFWKQR